MAEYPSNIKNFGNDVVGGDPVYATHVNEIRDEIEAIESTLGKDALTETLSVIDRLNTLIQTVNSVQNDLINTIDTRIKNINADQSKANNDATKDDYGVVKKAELYDSDGNKNAGANKDSVIDTNDLDNAIEDEFNKYFENGKLKQDALPVVFNKMVFLGTIEATNNADIKLNSAQLAKLKTLDNGYGGYIIIRCLDSNKNPLSSPITVNLFNVSQTSASANPTNETTASYPNTKIYDMAQIQFIKTISGSTITYNLLFNNGLGIISISAEGIPYNTQYVDIKLNDFKSFNDHKRLVGNASTLGHARINQQDEPTLWDLTSNTTVPRMKDIRAIQNILSMTTQSYINTYNMHLQGSNLTLDAANNYGGKSTLEKRKSAISAYKSGMTIIDDGENFTGGTLFNTMQTISFYLPTGITKWKQLEIEFLKPGGLTLMATQMDNGDIIMRSKGTITGTGGSHYGTWSGWNTSWDKGYMAYGIEAMPNNSTILTGGQITYDSSKSAYKITLTFSFSNRGYAYLKSKPYRGDHYYELSGMNSVDTYLPVSYEVKY